LKRSAWHHCIPELATIETESFVEEFREGLVHYIKNPEEAQSSFIIRTLPELGKRVQEVVQQYLNNK
jgi:hypothetical protein